MLVDSQSGDESSQLRLGDALRDLDELDGELTIYVASGQTVDLAIPAALVDEGIDNQPEGMAYLIEVHLARDVLRVWKAWRDGQEPTREEACSALSYYASHDAYQPRD
ncbi:hypothetical protein [Actinacidiphila yeochonensis]|uniref:hypothetical protein n=1 Tax=Actinacidiphila yeochonensis TaxID=89050 RepID=UPI0012FEF7FD|nr:hypothetical protein [Actinacidiphila yeochonensis]